jgi:hypothetical protein
MSEQKDRLVSTALLEQRLAELEAEVEADKKKRPATDPFFTHVSWMIAEFRAALKLAALEYRATADVVALTGWSAQTLREKGREVLAGRDPGEGWRELLVRLDAGEWAFAISTVPVKQTGELRRAG